MPEALEGLDSAELLLMVEDKAESSAVILTEPSNQIWGLWNDGMCRHSVVDCSATIQSNAPACHFLIFLSCFSSERCDTFNPGLPCQRASCLQ